MDKKKSLLILLSSIPVSAFFTSFYSNQKIASILNYQPQLFGSLGPLGFGDVQVYMPFSWVGWYLKFGDQKGASALFQEFGFEPLLTGFTICFGLAAVMVAMFKDKKSELHGSAHFATKDEIYEFGHFKDDRPIWEIIWNFLVKFFSFFKKNFTVILFINFLFTGIAGLVSNYYISSIFGYQPSFGILELAFPYSWFYWYFSFGIKHGRSFLDVFNSYGFAYLYFSLFVVNTVTPLLFSYFIDKEFFTWLWSSSRKANDNDLTCGKGVFLGYLDDGTYLRDNAKTHTLLVAPTRSGKGVGHIIPTLLTWEGSTVVTDVKGENWELTSGYRKSQLGNDVFMFKPMSSSSCHYNPLGEIRIGTEHEMGDLQLITKILVDPTGKGSEGENAHWVDNAWQLLQGVVLHLLYQKKYHNFRLDEHGKPVPLPGRTANLSDVLDYLYDDQDGAENILDQHANFIKNKDEKMGRLQAEKMSGLGGLDISNLNTGALEEAVDVSKGVSGDGAGTQSENGANNDPNPKPNDVPSLCYADGSLYNPNNNKNGEGLKGLQAKLKRYITDYQLKTRRNVDGEIEDYVGAFCHAPNDDPDLFVRLYPDKVNREGLHPHVRQIFQAMIDKPDKEFGSILSTLDTALIIYRNPVLVENTSTSDLVMKDLMDCEKPISLYLVFGPGEIDVVRPLCRVIVEMMWRLNVEEMKFENGKMLEHKHRLLMLLDEFPALGKMGGIEQSEGFLAGYGIKLMIITQDLNQINKLYGKDNYVISNCQVQIYHGPSDNNSSKYLSDKLGTKTEKQTSYNRNSLIFPGPNSMTDSFTSRPLMYADEISRLDDSKLLLFCKGLPPVLCNKVKYFNDEIFGPRVKIKAPSKSDKIDNSKRKWDFDEYVLLKSEEEIVNNDSVFEDVDELKPEVFCNWSNNGEEESVPVEEIENWFKKG